MKTKIILASASPRRKELLRIITDDFSVVTADADEESIDKSLPVEIYVQELALLKAAAAAKAAGRQKNTVIISADTVVYNNNNKIMGKPKDNEEAFKMLSDMSAKVHSVYTGVCIMEPDSAKTVCRYEMTKVRFKELDPDTIMAYIKTGEPMDKAGAYGIQGKGALLVSGIEGDYHNVVGLPLSLTADMLKNEFNINCF